MSKHFPRKDECPPEDDRCRHLAGLRTVASVELLKGIAVLAGGFALFAFRHKDMGDLAERFVEHLRLDPGRHIVHVFIQAADRITDRKVVGLAVAAFAYATLRFIEGYGLWHARVWAEWLAIISGALYLPWEILEVIKHDDRVRWALLIINIFVVLYMIYVRWDSLKAHRAGSFSPAAADG
jgi:uncharacterized membrane protein (DUF2068 family)